METYFSIKLFFGHYVENVLLFKLNIFAEGKCSKKIEPSTPSNFKI